MMTSKEYRPTMDRPRGTALMNVLYYPIIDGTASFNPDDVSDKYEHIAVPSTTKGRMHAVIFLANKNIKYGTHFDSADVGNLQSVFHSSGDILRARHKFKHDGNRVEQLEDLLNIMSVDASEINLGFLSDRVVALSKAARGTIFVIDDVTHELYFMINTPGGKLEIRMPLTAKSMAGAAILNNELINIPDCYQDDRFDPTMDKRTGFKTRQMLCVPVTALDGQPIGCIQVINTHHGMSFTDADVELLRTFRVYVQIAMLNSKATTAAEHAIQLAKQAITIGTNLSWTHRPEDLLHMYFSQTCKALGADYIALTMPQPKDSSENKLLRYDNQEKMPYPVSLTAGTGTYAVTVRHKFLNVGIEDQGSLVPSP